MPGLPARFDRAPHQKDGHGILIAQNLLLILSNCRISFKTVFGQLNVEFDWIAPIEAGFTEMLFRLGYSRGPEKTVDAEIVEGI